MKSFLSAQESQPALCLQGGCNNCAHIHQRRALKSSNGFSYHRSRDWTSAWGSCGVHSLRLRFAYLGQLYTPQKAKLLGKYASETRLDVYGCNGKSSPYLAEGGCYPVCPPPLQSSLLSPTCHHPLPLTEVTWLVQDEARTQIQEVLSQGACSVWIHPSCSPWF